MAEEVAALVPKPADGKSVTLDEIRPLLDEIVAAKVAEIPLPRDGKDVEPEAVRAMVAEAVEALPKPADGKSVTLDEGRPLVDETVAATGAPIALPGADADATRDPSAADVTDVVEAKPDE